MPHSADMTTAPIPEETLESLGIASALISARTAMGLTQADLAEKSGISRSAIKGYETGRNMPGSRELRSLCKTLRVSPNMLLFGSENLFSDDSINADTEPGMRLLLGDPEDMKRARARLSLLADLLTPDEVEALLRLMTSLATARHGPELVKKQMIGADLMTAMGMAFQAAAKSGGKPVDFEALMETSLERGGNLPKE